MAPPLTKDEQRFAMFEALMKTDRDYLTADDFERVIGRSRSTTNQRLRELQNMGLVEREWRWDQICPRFRPSDWVKPYRAAFRTVADFERNLRFGPHSCIVEDADRRVIYRGDDFDEAALVKLKTPGRALLLERDASA